MSSSVIGRWRSALTLGLPPSAGMREALQWLMLARLGVLYSLLAGLVLQQIFRGDAGSSAFILGYALLAVCFAFNLLNACFLERLPAHRSVAALHVVFDAVLTAVWLNFSGGKESLFALLYLIQILTVSLILYQRGALWAAVLASLGFGFVILRNPAPNGLLVWAAYAGLFVLLGVVGGYLSEELLRTNERLKDKSRKMERLMALHEQILADLPTGLLTVDAEMRINFMNPAAEHILGRTSADAVGRELAEVEIGLMPFFSQINAERIADEEESPGPMSAASDSHPAPNASPGEEMSTAVAVMGTGGEHRRTFLMEEKKDHTWARLQQVVEIGRGAATRILRGDVAELEADAGLGRLLDKPAPGGRVLLFQDVTKLLNLEEKLKQNEKLAAVGQLAAGIAHEIRNPLASMSASIEMLKGSLPVDGTYRENQKLMEIAIREIDRLNRLISEFLDFVKPDKLKLAPVDLDALLEEILLSVQRSKDFTERITLKRNIQAGVRAQAHAEKLKQVIWNLVVNAMQAMSKPGELEVGCAAHGEARVKFWVQDQGQGMTEETLSHLYEPFFTTKEKGTGLGLATAYKIIEAHHGEIRVKSTPNVGTRFEIVLPRA